MINMHSLMKGRYKLIARDGETLETTKETDWFDNLILDIGLNRLGTGGIIDRCKVGTSNAAVNVTQTDLVAPIATTTTKQIIGPQAYVAGPPAYMYARITFRFAVGAAAGNLSEVGVGWGNTSSLWSRALIVDNLGNPTTITVLSTEVLDVVYELRIERSTPADVVTNMVIDGVNTTVTLRRAEIDDAIPLWGSTISIGSQGAMPGSGTPVAYNGVLGPVDGEPTGSSSSGSQYTYEAYSNNSYQRVQISTFSLTQGNLSGGITAMRVLSCLGRFQIGFSPAIAKTNTKTLSMRFNWSWGRAP